MEEEEEKVAPLHFPVEKYDLLENVVVPDFAFADEKLQEYLENINSELIPEISQFIAKEFTKKKIRIVLDQILFYSNLRVKRNEIYADLLINLQKEIDIVFDPITIGKSNGLLLRTLYKKGVYTKQQIKDSCQSYTVVKNNKTYRPLYFYFAPEFGLYLKDAHYYGINEEYLNKLKEDEWYLWNEVITYGYETHSVQYAIKYDDFIAFQQCMGSYGPDDTIELNKFEGLLRGQSIKISHACALFGAEKCFRFVIDDGCMFNSELCDWAARGGNMDILRLCKLQEDFTFENSYKYACLGNNKEAADFVLQNGGEACDITEIAQTNFVLGIIFVLGYTESVPAEALHNALINGFRTTARLLLLEECGITYKTNSNRTIVHEAADHAYLEILVLLKERLADFLVADVVGTVPLHLAARAKDIDCLTLVLGESTQPSRGSVINALDDFGSPLHYACRYGFEEGCIKLVEAGADVNIAGAGGYTPLHIASKKNYETIVRYLKEKGAQMDAKSAKGHIGRRLTNSYYVKGLYN